MRSAERDIAAQITAVLAGVRGVKSVDFVTVEANDFRALLTGPAASTVQLTIDGINIRACAASRASMWSVPPPRRR